MKDWLDLLMFIALCGFIVLGFPVSFTLAGTALIFALIGMSFGIFDPDFLGVFPHRIYGVMTNEVLIAVPLFVFMGVMLERSKVAEELLDTMGQLFGTLRGGLGIAVCVVGALLAASTGIVGATVVTMGLISLPTMLRRGYDPKLACGLIAAAGTLGQIIPPSIVLVVLGDQISNAHQEAQRALGNFSPEPVSVGDLFAGALIPGLLLVALYILYQIAIAYFKPESSPAIPRDESMQVGNMAARVMHALVAPIVLIVSVLGSIIVGIATPTEAAGVGAVGATLLAGHRLAEGRPIPVYAAALSLIGVIVLTTFVDMRVTRTQISTGENIASAIAGIVLFSAVKFGTSAPLVGAGVAGFVGAFGLPRWFLGKLIKRRQNKFLSELANAVDVVVRGVKTGLPLNECLGIIARESPEPIASEFREVVEEQRMGVPLGDALERMSQRLPLAEVRFLAIVISIQQQAGGNLSEALGNLSGVLRDRIRLQQKVKALSAEAKASAMVLGSLPPTVMIMVYLSSPDYLVPLFTTTVGKFMLCFGAFWMFCGVMIMRKMINFKY